MYRGGSIIFLSIHLYMPQTKNPRRVTPGERNLNIYIPRAVGNEIAKLRIDLNRSQNEIVSELLVAGLRARGITVRVETSEPAKSQQLSLPVPSPEAPTQPEGLPVPEAPGPSYTSEPPAWATPPVRDEFAELMEIYHPSAAPAAPKEPERAVPLEDPFASY